MALEEPHMFARVPAAVSVSINLPVLRDAAANAPALQAAASFSSIPLGEGGIRHDEVVGPSLLLIIIQWPYGNGISTVGFGLGTHLPVVLSGGWCTMEG